MKKRALALVLTAAMVLGLTACGGSSDGTTTDSTTDGQTAETAETEAEAEASASATGEKILSVQVGPDPETALLMVVTCYYILLNVFWQLTKMVSWYPDRQSPMKYPKTDLHGHSI